jgi:hypothetical protein
LHGKCFVFIIFCILFFLSTSSSFFLPLLVRPTERESVTERVRLETRGRGSGFERLREKQRSGERERGRERQREINGRGEHWWVNTGGDGGDVRWPG